jgi:dienelactone hydrolase
MGANRIGGVPGKNRMMGRPEISRLLAIVLLTCILGGCSQTSVEGNLVTITAHSQDEIATALTQTQPAPSLTPVYSIPTATSTATPSATHTATLTATPDPYLGWTIPYLQGRSFGGGSLEIVETIADNSFFDRYLIRYPSDGLDIYGFANIPKIPGPIPVVIAIHGYIDPAVYGTLDYTTRYADDLARRGFLVIHPNLRNYPPSEPGENLFRVGMAVDILNLIGIVRETAGVEGGLLQQADGNRIGLWGHSMGGGISTRVMTVDQEIDAVVLYAAMSGDERKNFEAILDWSDGERGREELLIPEEVLSRISPENYFDQIKAAVSIHHGLADELIPVQWSRDTCEQLNAAEVRVSCNYYPGQPHTFWGEVDLLFMQDVANFFLQHLGATKSP